MNFSNAIKQFGCYDPKQQYIERRAAYLIIFDHEKRLLAVEYHGKYYLPGGGVEDGESFNEALCRELMEETGMSAKIGQEVVTAGEYLFAKDEDCYFNIIGHFFLGDLTGKTDTKTEEDHLSLWLYPVEFASGAARESHVWSVKTSLKKI